MDEVSPIYISNHFLAPLSALALFTTHFQFLTDARSIAWINRCRIFCSVIGVKVGAWTTASRLPSTCRPSAPRWTAKSRKTSREVFNPFCALFSLLFYTLSTFLRYVLALQYNTDHEALHKINVLDLYSAETVTFLQLPIYLCASRKREIWKTFVAKALTIWLFQSY